METNDVGTSLAETVIVDTHHGGQRIDNFLLTLLKGVPRSHVYRLLRTGQVRVNKGRIRPEYRLKQGDAVRLPPVRYRAGPRELRPTPAQRRLVMDSIIYEDGALLALNKPTGMPVHGGSGLSTGLVNLLQAVRADLPYIELAHRLDRHTSGCLLFAKRRDALQGLHTQFREGEVDKCYIALVKGRWEGEGRRVDAPMAHVRHSSGERRMGVHDTGKAAVTQFLPLCVADEASLVEARPVTGRTHQIRVHAALIGHPIAGDAKYGDWVFNRALRERGLKRLFLHAHRLELARSTAGRPLRLHAPLPAELRRVLRDCCGHDAPFCPDCL